MELFSLTQVPGVGWALVGTWSPQVKVGWAQDILQLLVGLGSVGIPGASCWIVVISRNGLVTFQRVSRAGHGCHSCPEVGHDCAVPWMVVPGRRGPGCPTRRWCFWGAWGDLWNWISCPHPHLGSERGGKRRGLHPPSPPPPCQQLPGRAVPSAAIPGFLQA